MPERWPAAEEAVGHSREVVRHGEEVVRHGGEGGLWEKLISWCVAFLKNPIRLYPTSTLGLFYLGYIPLYPLLSYHGQLPNTGYDKTNLILDFFWMIKRNLRTRHY